MKILEFMGMKNIEDLKKGIKENNKMAAEFLELTKMLLEKSLEEDVTEIKGKDDLLNFLRADLGFLKHEEFKVIFLNNSNKVTYQETLFVGTIDRSAVYPRTIIEKALQYNARGVIFAHNHPSGNLTPSKKDIDLTLELQELLDKLDIRLLDHIIISETSHYSFYENDIIEYF